jgi:RNA 2',3'-cyclic 3'-phosphodiesterase
MFVALDLPEMVREDITAWSEAELADPALRRVPQESLHITLAFLGNRPPADVERIAEAMEEAADRQVLLELGSPVGRPAQGKPRLVALPVLHGPVPGLQARLSEILSFERLYEPEKRPFWPHVTLARVKRGVRQAPALEGEPELVPFTASVVTLYRSVLRPQGALYEPLEQLSLSRHRGVAKS